MFRNVMLVVLSSLLAVALAFGLPGLTALAQGSRSYAETPQTFLGARVLPAQNGMLVQALRLNSAAARAGLRVGDIITAINGKPVIQADSLDAVLESFEPGDVLILSVRRGEKAFKLTATMPGQPVSLERLFNLNPLRYLREQLQREMAKQSHETLFDRLFERFPQLHRPAHQPAERSTAWLPDLVHQMRQAMKPGKSIEIAPGDTLL
ncbi:MAG: hypothetical protein Kow0077_22360 [Anaerolineae bacterium]